MLRLRPVIVAFFFGSLLWLAPLRAEPYRIVDTFVVIADLDAGHDDTGWYRDEANTTLIGKVIEVSQDSGTIIFDGTVNGTELYHRMLPLADINRLIDEKLGADGPIIDDGTGRYRHEDFPFAGALVGPTAMAVFRSVAPGTPVFAYQEAQYTGLGRFVLPGAGGILLIDHGPVMVGPRTGIGLIQVTVFHPEADGLDFSDLQRDGDAPADELEFSEDEAREGLDGDDENLEFDEAEVRDFIRSQNDDHLKLMGCAAGLSSCPPGVRPDTVHDMFDITEGDDEARQLVLDLYRAAEAAAGKKE